MLARVTLSNVGQQDIAIGAGPAGVIQPELWFDAQLRGVAQQGFPGLAYDRIMSRTILRPRESISQIIRIDQGDLANILKRTPVGLLIVDADVILNPLLSQEGVRLGPGGVYTPFAKMFSRVSEPLSSDLARGKFLQSMAKATPPEVLQDIDLLAAYVQAAAAPSAAQAEKEQAQKYLDVIAQQRQSTDAGVASWAALVWAELSDGPARQKAVEELAASQAWQSRLLALVATQWLSPDVRKEIAGRLAQSDSDADVKTFAAATLEAPATTQPATSQPAATQANK
jgi:hypothetical protein